MEKFIDNETVAGAEGAGGSIEETPQTTWSWPGIEGPKGTYHPQENRFNEAGRSRHYNLGGVMLNGSTNLSPPEGV